MSEMKGNATSRRRTYQCHMQNIPPQEVESQGEAIYAQQILNKVEVEHKGKFLVVNIETGEYEIDEDDLVATKVSLHGSLTRWYMACELDIQRPIDWAEASRVKSDDDRHGDRRPRSR